MEYYYIAGYTEQSRPIWGKASCLGFRRKNGADQVAVKDYKKKLVWIFAPIVELDK